MKKYIKFILLVIFFIFSLAALIIFLEYSKNKPTMSNEVLNYFSKCQPIITWMSGVHSFANDTYFWMSYLGFDNFIELCGNSTWGFYAVDVFVFLPILGIVTCFTWSVYLLSFVFNKMRRVDVLSFLKTINIVWRTILIIAVMIMLINFITIESFESSKYSSDLFLKWYNQSPINDGKIINLNGNNIILDSLNLFSAILQFGGTKEFLNEIPAPYGGSMISLIFLVPILAFIAFALFCSYYGARIILVGHNLGVGKKIEEISRWAKYQNIASKREVNSRYFKNVPLMIMIPTCLMAIIFPVLIPLNFQEHKASSIIFIIFSLILLILIFIPTYLIFYKVKKMQPAKYNLYILIQIILIFVVGFIWQLILWIFFYNKFVYLDYVPLIIILVYFICSITAYLIFISKKY